MCGISNKKVESEVFYFVFFCFNYTIYIILMSTVEGIYFTATAFTLKKYKKAPQAHVLGSRVTPHSVGRCQRS